MATVEPSSRIGVTLDLILKTLIASADFNTLNSKNWEAIARLIPGTNSSQVRVHTNICYLLHSFGGVCGWGGVRILIALDAFFWCSLLAVLVFLQIPYPLMWLESAH